MNFLRLFLVMFPMSAAVKPVSKDGKPCTLRHFKKASSGNQALRPSILISSHNVDLLAECHLLCVNASNCYGYNFRVRPSSIYTVNCQLSNSSVKMNMTKMRKGAWNFYEDVLVTKDVDECSQDSHKCHSNATCMNTPGSYDCQCRSGYTGSGRSCRDIDECLKKSNHCHSNANCTNTGGSYKCKCNQGYQGNGKNCTDIDECSEGIYECHADANCKNTQGSYNCICPSGKYCKNLKDVSEILRNEPVQFEKKLEEWLPRTGNWRICWSTRVGWAASTFHSRCDGKSPTITIVQVTNNNKTYVFGGYATVAWKPIQNKYYSYYTSASGSFIFSLRNKDDLPPFKAPLNDRNDGYAIYRYSRNGPTFGNGHDLHIASDAKSNTNSYTNFGWAYQAPSEYTRGQANTKSLLAGSLYFTPSEVEVLYLN